MNASNRNRNAKKPELVVLEQFVEVTVRNGVTVTELYPPNSEMLELLAGMDPPPDRLYRRFNFRGSVPPEYHWATRDPLRWLYGGGALQRMRPAYWLGLIVEEELSGTGHLRPCREPMPRPAETGGCACHVCTAAQARIDREGA
jgi:hypothetical protein